MRYYHSKKWLKSEIQSECSVLGLPMEKFGLLKKRQMYINCKVVVFQNLLMTTRNSQWSSTHVSYSQKRCVGCAILTIPCAIPSPALSKHILFSHKLSNFFSSFMISPNGTNRPENSFNFLIALGDDVELIAKNLPTFSVNYH